MILLIQSRILHCLLKINYCKFCLVTAELGCFSEFFWFRAKYCASFVILTHAQLQNKIMPSVLRKFELITVSLVTSSEKMSLLYCISFLAIRFRKDDFSFGLIKHEFSETPMHLTERGFFSLTCGGVQPQTKNQEADSDVYTTYRYLLVLRCCES